MGCEKIVAEVENVSQRCDQNLSASHVRWKPSLDQLERYALTAVGSLAGGTLATISTMPLTGDIQKSLAIGSFVSVIILSYVVVDLAGEFMQGASTEVDSQLQRDNRNTQMDADGNGELPAKEVIDLEATKTAVGELSGAPQSAGRASHGGEEAVVGELFNVK